MRIVVLVKQVTSPHAVRVDPRPEPVVNEYDLHAVESAIRLREQTGIGEVVVASLGPAKDALRRCLAMGADRTVIIDAPRRVALDSLTTATLLATFLRQEGVDLILTGQETSDSGTGSVGPQLAALLDLPVVSNVVEIAVDDDGRLTLRRDIEDGRQELRLDGPAVLCTLAGPSQPRFPTLKGILTARHKPVDVRTLDDLGIAASELEPVVAWGPPFAPEAGHGIIVKGSDPHTAAEELVSFLRQRKLI